MVLEYVDDGELFQHISNKGRLSEEEAVKYFRQILSGIDYCHSYNICHRDLKPENILLNKQGEVRIADFGMAALQQTAEHRLQTSCGSPHYAAPEVVRGGPYHGNRVDIWSLGVILFAMLSGHLPFDCPSMTKLLQAIQRGKYVMPQALSSEAQNLIHNMLQIDPRRRIPIDNIWQHPLMRKYAYLDDYGRISSNVERLRDCGRPVSRKSDIDKDLLRHLRSMWHSLEEAQIVKLLLNEEANDQKLFYALLLRHRERQLENYAPDVNYSKSDYHHGDHPSTFEEPIPDLPKSSTRQFIQAKGKGHNRQVSRFTVVSNISKGRSSNRSRSGSNAATEGGQDTMHSYDPYNHARTKHVATAVIANAKVVVHKGKANLHERVSPMPIVTAGHSINNDDLAAPRRYATRSSLASSTRSHTSSQLRVPMANKRGIIFPHNHRHSAGHAMSKALVPASRHSRFSEVTDDGGDTLRAVHARPGPSHLSQAGSSTQPAQINTNKRASHVWKSDVRKLSSSLAEDCDNAFYRASGTTVSGIGTARSSAFDLPDDDTPASSVNNYPTNSGYFDPADHKRSSRDQDLDRPLPVRPERSVSTRAELEDLRRRAMTQRITGNTDLSASHLERMVTHIDELLAPSPHKRPESKSRRTASAPIRTAQQNEGHYGTLQAINEASFEESPKRERMSDYDEFLARERLRNSSAPETYGSTARPPKIQGRLSEGRHATRPVAPSSPLPAKPPAPLNIRKRSSHGASPLSPLALSSDITEQEGNAKRPGVVKYHSTRTQSTAAERFTYSEDLASPRTNIVNTVQKKKSTWFGRSTSNEVEDSTLPADVTAPSQSSSDRTVRPLYGPKASEPASKKSMLGLGRFFKRSNKDIASNSVFQIQEGDDLSITSIDDHNRRSQSNQTEGEPRQIATQRNWWAKLFHVKPAKRYLAFTVSKHRARRELANLLREWKKYGVRDVVVDPQRNMIFARIGPKNCE